MLDDALGFKDFDRDAFLASFKQAITSDPQTPAQAADCAVNNVSELSDDQLEDLFLNSNKQLEQQVFNPCF